MLSNATIDHVYHLENTMNKFKSMRNFETLSKLIILTLFLFACEGKNDDNSPENESHDFILKAEKDSKSWVATKAWSVLSNKDDKFTLSGAMEDSVYSQEEALRITIDQNKIAIGEKLRDFDASLSFIIGGDGIAWSYEKIEDIKESFILINELDTVNKRIKGEFELWLKDSINGAKYYMILKNGEFDLPYKDTDN